MRPALHPIFASMMAAVMALAACMQVTSPAPANVPVERTTIPVLEGSPTVATAAGTQPLASYKDATYQIDGKPIALVNGLSKAEAAPGSASRIITRYFGNDAVGDLNGDGKEDVAFLLTQDTGGSGIFYYVVVALRTATGYQGTNAVLLGDRIAPQTTNIEKGMVVVNYAERKPDKSFAIRPSVGISKYLKLIGSTLVETNAQ